MEGVGGRRGGGGGGGGRGRGGGRGDGGVAAVAGMRKGPWAAEEDEILVEYVKMYGPRDWSSIRSRGLLPRTGKSCRLRWVNRLQPDLKTGCKFTAEEERIVIELQARFGNKWARIATYLPGRTDNDVKNFWSTRQKRLARILKTTATTTNSHGKLPVLNEDPAFFEAPRLDLFMPFGEDPQSAEAFSRPPRFAGMGEPYMVQLSDHNNITQNMLKLETTFPPLEPSAAAAAMDEDPPPPCLLDDLSHPLLLGLPLLPQGEEEEEELAAVGGLADVSFFQDMFAHGEFKLCDQLPGEVPFFGLQDSGLGGKRDCSDGLFEDFPADMFDYSEPLPSSSEW